MQKKLIYIEIIYNKYLISDIYIYNLKILTKDHYIGQHHQFDVIVIVFWNFEIKKKNHFHFLITTWTISHDLF